MLKMVDGTGIIGVDMICPLGVSTPQPPNYDRVELEGTGMLVLPNSLDAPLDRLELGGKTEQVQTTGAQLFDSKLFGTVSNTGGATVTNNGDGTFSVSGNGTLTKIFNVSHEYSKEQTLSMLKAGKLHARASANVFPYPSFVIFSNGQWTELNMDSTTEKTADITEEMLNSEDLKSRFRFFGKIDNAIKSGTVKIMLYQDGNGDYEPYTGGKHSPSQEYQQEIKNSGKWNEETQKYEVDVKITGKNLFNREKAKDESNWKHISGYQNYPIYVGTGNKVTFSYLEKLNTGLPLYFGVGFKESSISEYMYHATTSSLIANKKTLTATGDHAYLIVSESNVSAFLDAIQTFQVEISPTQTDYAPYKEQTLTLTSDRPITKWDRLVEQGGQIGWLYNSVNETIDGKTGKWSIQPANKIFYRTDITFPIVVPFCIELLGYDYSMGGYKKDTGITINNLGILCITLPEEVELTLDAYKQYLADNPLHVLYKGDSEEFIPLPQEEQDAIRALKTYYPTTVITADGGELDPDIKVTYRKEI